MSCTVCDHHHEAAAAAAASGVNIVKSGRGRKPSNKANAQKKQKKTPQRGMGVAQLERLRQQEMPPPTPSIQNGHLKSHMPFPEPIPSVPVLHGAGHYGMPSVVVGNGLLGPLEESRVLHSGGGGRSGQVLMSKNLVGLGTSKELSSMPKNMHVHHHQQPWGVLPQQHCDICLKKKRFHGENMGFPGLINPTNTFNFYEGMNVYGARAARSAFYAGQYHDNNFQNQVTQAVLIHRNGNSMGRNVPREYEFFPGKGGKSTSSKDLEFPLEEASVAVHGEASWFTPTAYYSDSNACGPSNSIDLSLKLSV
ncbi:protein SPOROCYTELESS [Citrus sinensis]|uniref:Protein SPOROCYTELESS n=1 Tax=Citrus sinensis TaxID=2711 RepID=A0ACB8NYP9_CITSI|nr:protein SPOROCYTELESS [Citrus sinensis]